MLGQRNDSFPFMPIVESNEWILSIDVFEAYRLTHRG